MQKIHKIAESRGNGWDLWYIFAQKLRGDTGRREQQKGLEMPKIYLTGEKNLCITKYSRSIGMFLCMAVPVQVKKGLYMFRKCISRMVSVFASVAAALMVLCVLSCAGTTPAMSWQTWGGV